jgi:hypothetical protein
MDEQIEAVEKVVEVAFRTSPRVLTAVSLISLAVGASVGAVLANKRLKRKYEDIANREVAQAREHYENLSLRGAETGEVRGILNGSGTTRVVVAPPEVVSAMRAYQGDPTNPELAETDVGYMMDRDTSKPHFISEDEFNAAELDYQQPTLTYFVLDETLTDDRDEIIVDVAETVSTEVLLMFHADPELNTIHVRNPHRQLDFEIVRGGSYAKDVAGL